MAANDIEVLAEPTRRRILDLLLDRERPVGDLVKRLKLSQPGVSKHLRVLREAGLVSVRTEGAAPDLRRPPRALAEAASGSSPIAASGQTVSTPLNDTSTRRIR